MKRLILFVFFLSLFTATHAQYYLRMGYDAGYYNMDNLDILVKNYSSSRSWLDDPLDEIHLMHGPQAGIGRQFKNITAEARWTGHYTLVSATGTPPSGNTETRYLRARDGIVSAEARYHPERSRFGGGLSFDVTYFQTLTRLASAKKYTHFERTTTAGFTASACFLPLRKRFNLGITGYYHFSVGQAEIDKLWYYLDKPGYTGLRDRKSVV